MSKEAYYFSHDSNARNDPKIQHLRSEYGIAGYAYYWVIIEMLREADDYKLPKKPYMFNAIAMQMQCKDYAKEDAKSFVEFCINECDLLQEDETHFWSKSLLKRMDKKNELSEKRAAAAKKRWEKASKDADFENDVDANAMQNNANAEQKSNLQSIKEKEIKEKEIKKDIKNNSAKEKEAALQKEFDQFWDLYPKKQDKKKAFLKFKVQRKEYDFEDIMKGTKAYTHKCTVEGTEKQYIKLATTFLNGECFTELHEVNSSKAKRTGVKKQSVDLEALKAGLDLSE